MAIKHGLGRGLGALIKDGVGQEEPVPQPAGSVLTVPVSAVKPGAWQPRHTFDEAALAGLAESIKARGVLQPLLVRTTEDGYELIAGERRWRAARVAELTQVPVIVVDAVERDALEIALIENLQREDLNAIEEAEAYQALVEKFQMTQEQVAERVGKARASVANALRLLRLPEEVRRLVSGGTLSAGHAKALGGLDIPDEQILLARRIVREGLSVRALEKLVDKASRPPRRPRVTRSDMPGQHLRDLSDRLHRRLGTSVRLTPSCTLANGAKRKGTLEIDFYSNDDLDRLLDLIGLPDE